MQEDLELHFPSSEINIIGVNRYDQGSQNDLMTDNTDLPWLQDVDANSNSQSDAWETWGAAWRDAIILNGDNERMGVLNLTPPTDITQQENYDLFRGMVADAVKADRVAETEWQNQTEPLDLNKDGFVTALDALVAVNEINANGVYELPDISEEPDVFYDAFPDGALTAQDPLLVISHLNDTGGLVEGEPEGEPAAIAAPSTADAASKAAAARALAAAALLDGSDKDRDVGGELEEDTNDPRRFVV